jgi:hypothetical protein
MILILFTLFRIYIQTTSFSQVEKCADVCAADNQQIKHAAFLPQIVFLFCTAAVSPPCSPPPTQWGEGGPTQPPR